MRSITVASILAALVVAYPAIIYFGLQNWQPRQTGIVLAILFLARLLYTRGQKSGQNDAQQTSLLATGLAIPALLCMLCTLVFNHEQFLLYTPVMINLSLLGVFLYSYIRPPSIIERFARLQKADLPPEELIYTQRVTLAWCLFFAINGGIAFISATYASYEIWAIYNGVIGYLLIGLMAGGELAYRKLVLRW